MDVEGDALRGVRTVARVWGAAKARWVSIVFYLSAVLMSPLPFFLAIDPEFQYDMVYAAPVLVTDVLLIFSCVRLVGDWRVSSVNRLRRVTMLALFMGLVAYLGAALL
jgi:geranylgeranylglycerol-phosphate geranylgeranyltransferase